MTPNRKRGRNAREDEVEFMPLSKRINNLHINGGLLLDSGTQPNAAWGPGPPYYQNCLLPYNAPETPPESVQSLSFSNTAPQYNPVLSEAENPHYFYKNKLLFEMHVERMQRAGQNY